MKLLQQRIIFVLRDKKLYGTTNDKLKIHDRMKILAGIN